MMPWAEAGDESTPGQERWYCSLCGSDAAPTGLSLDGLRQIGTCLTAPTTHRDCVLAETRDEAMSMLAASRRHNHTLQHSRHIAVESVSRYCDGCYRARQHTLHRRYRRPHEECHLCARQLASPLPRE